MARHVTHLGINDDASNFKGAFATAALHLRQHGLCPIPCGGSDGKRPLVKWPKKPYCEATIKDLAKKHPDANVGILAEPSGVTVVDVDEPTQIGSVMRRFGPTPLITATPSGGRHFWYRSDGERNVTGLEGLAIDIRGVGGLVVVPPSVNFQTGRAYSFAQGNWGVLGCLPKIKPGSLQGASQPAPVASIKTIPLGRRNNTLFRKLLRQSPRCDTFDDLLDVAQTINDESMDAPLTGAEVEKTARSAWAFEVDGQNWVGTSSRVVLMKDYRDALMQNTDGLVLWVTLQGAFGGSRTPFPVCAVAMVDAGTIPKWGVRRIRSARDWLVHNGFLECTHQGGSCRGDVSLYRFIEKGVRKAL